MDEFIRKPIIKLIIRKADKDTSDRVKLSFYIINTGNAAAEKVQLRFALPDSLKPVGEPRDQCVSFFNSDIERGIKYSFAENEIIYPSQKKSNYQLSFNLMLSFKIPQRNIKDKIFRLGYVIDYTGGSVSQETPFENPLSKQ